jgi:hypothetical protein
MVHVMSPYIVSICGFSAKVPYVIASEFVTGGELRARVFPAPGKTFKPLSPTENTIIALGIARGLEVIHSKNIMHRDLKAANVLLDKDAYPHICDLGIARFEDDDESALKTQSLGTPSYMAPELLMGGEYNTMVDIYSFGMVLYELSERKKALGSVKSPQELYQVLFVKRMRPEMAATTSPACRALVERCTDLDPNARCTATETVEYILAHIADLFPGTKKAKVQQYEKWAAKKLRSLAGGLARAGPAHVFSSPKRRRPPPGEPEKKHAPTPAEVERELAEYLLNPAHPRFGVQLMYIARIVTEQQLPRVLPAVIKHIEAGRPQIFQTVCVEAVALLVARCPAALPVLAQSGFFSALPVNADTIDVSLDLVVELIDRSPRSVGVAHIATLSRMVALAPDKTMAVLVHFWRTATWIGVPECAMFLAIANNCAPALLSSPAALLLLRILADLAKRVPAFLPAIANAGDIVAGFLPSALDAVVATAYRLINLCGKPPAVPAALLAAHVAKEALLPHVFRFLIRSPAVEAGAPLIAALIARPRDPLAWAVLAKLAAADPEPFASSGAWIEKAVTNPKDVLGVFLAAAAVPAVRPRLFALPQYYAMLRLCSKLRDEEVTAALAFAVVRSERSETALRRLSLEGFWRFLLDAAAVSKSSEVARACMAAVSAFSEVGWTEEFGGYVRTLAGLLANDELAPGAMGTIAFLSYRQEAVPAIVALKMVDFLMKLTGVEYYGPLAKAILQNIGVAVPA